MADHLPLPGPTDPHPRRLSGYDPDAPPLRGDRSQHAHNLAGVLAGLGLPYPDDQVDQGDLEEESPDHDARVVLVFAGRAALRTGPFRGWKMTPLVETDGKGMAVLTAKESQLLFSRLVGQYGGDAKDWDNPKAWAEQLDAIDGVRLYSRSDREDERLRQPDHRQFPLVVDVTIWPSTLERESSRARVIAARLAEVYELINQARTRNEGIRIVAEDPRPDTPMLRIQTDELLLDALLVHPLVERISPPDAALVRHADLAAVAPPPESPEPTGEAIGVIDDLVLTNPYLEGVVAAQASFPETHAWRPPTQHGIQVASIASYGGLRALADDSKHLSAPHPVFAARILESNAEFPDFASVAGIFHVELESALRWLHSEGVRIVTCSVNSDVAATRAYPGEATAIIDALARELDMVVVVSAGNRTHIDPSHWRDDYPRYLEESDASVAEPGTAATAVTTGAIAWYDTVGSRGANNQIAIARAGRPSPFTRVGPTRGTTPSGTMKPEFAAHGGNWAWDKDLGLVQGDPSLGVITLLGPHTTGRLAGVADGTSYAAPYVAHEAAEILTRYPAASANLIRALLALSAETREVSSSERALAERAAGYGVPAAQRILESDRHRVVMTYEGHIPANSTVVHPIPIPAEFATGQLRQRLTVALAFDPEVRRTRRAYQAATMDVELVRNMPLEEVIAIYRRQPSMEAMVLDPALQRRSLPSGRQRPDLFPGSETIESNTLIRRRMRTSGWSPDDDGYFIVVRHDLEPWAKPATGDAPPQRYALAVELTLDAAVNIDLYALVRNELRLRERTRSRR